MSRQTGRLGLKVEDYKAEYPCFAALLASHVPFFLYHRFNRLRARLLLLKQERLSILEEKLDKIDQNEKCRLFLGTSRCDANAD
jgi:hypothetical protein